MATNPDSDREPSLADVLREISELRKALEQTQQRQEQGQKWQDTWQEQSQKWQDRTWDVVKWVGGISAGLAISAAIALVGVVLKSALTSQ